MKTYLACASHWNVPGVLQYSATDRQAANRKCVELVNELIADWATWQSTRGAEAPPPVIGSDWESSLRALQLCRLIDYFGGEGEANDALFVFRSRRSGGMARPDDEPMIGDGFTPELQELIADFVQDDDCSDPDAKIGFPMVWIEEVEQVDQGNPPAVDTADLETVIAAAQRFADEGEPADDPDQHERIVGAIERLKAPVGSYPHHMGALDFGKLMSVIGWAGQFATDWVDLSDDEPERERATEAARIVEEARQALPLLFATLGRTVEVLGYGIGAIDQLDHQVSQMKGMFPDDDGTIQQAQDDGEETRHMLGVARDDLKALGAQAAPPQSESRLMAALIDQRDAWKMRQAPADQEMNETAEQEEADTVVTVLEEIIDVADSPEVHLQPARVIVGVAGGVVQGASCDQAGTVQLFVVDYDNDCMDEDSEKEFFDVPQSGLLNGKPYTAEGRCYEETLAHDPVWVGAVLAAKAEHEADNGEG